MSFSKSHFIKLLFIYLSCFFSLIEPTQATEKLITSSTAKLSPLKALLVIDLTKENANEASPRSVQKSVVTKQGTLARRDPPQLDPAKRIKKDDDMQVNFLCGTDGHVQAYSDLIKKAESNIIIASWNVNFIPEAIFSSLLAAKKRGVYISFVVNFVKREETLVYFDNNEDGETAFQLFKTKSHAKFLFVDSKSLILGSFNALGESYDEADDASLMMQGSIKQLWPFYMSIYETYTSIGEDLGAIFGGIAGCSKFKNPGERALLQKTFKDGSKIFLLRSIKEHEDFFKIALMNRNEKITIYSPFSTKDNTLKRLQTLDSILPVGVEVHLKVLKRFESGLTRLLSLIPDLKKHTHIGISASHQKTLTIGKAQLCIGSLNWLSAAQDAKDSYSNVEFSIVLQGPKAEEIIKNYYSH